jgi:hypothetical protein
LRDNAHGGERSQQPVKGRGVSRARFGNYLDRAFPAFQRIGHAQSRGSTQHPTALVGRGYLHQFHIESGDGSLGHAMLQR